MVGCHELYTQVIYDKFQELLRSKDRGNGLDLRDLIRSQGETAFIPTSSLLTQLPILAARTKGPDAIPIASLEPEEKYISPPKISNSWSLLLHFAEALLIIVGIIGIALTATGILAGWGVPLTAVALYSISGTALGVGLLEPVYRVIKSTSKTAASSSARYEPLSTTVILPQAPPSISKTKVGEEVISTQPSPPAEEKRPKFN